MAYSESVFVFCLLLAMFGMHRRWKPIWIALIIGAATGTRVVGIALLPVFALHLWRGSASKSRFALNTMLLLPLACWGIGSYMAFQYIEFGDALAFVKTQEHWAKGPASPLSEQLWAALTLKPIWSVYDPSSVAYWRRYEGHTNPVFSMQFANPILFVGTILLIVVGMKKRWLSEGEWLLAALLILIPYFSHGHRALMMAEGRYAASAFPVYIVLGQIARRVPPALAGVSFGVCGLFLGAYAALFAVWHRVI